MTDLSQIQSAATSLFGTGLSQHARLLTLATAQGTALPESLVVERFSAREAVNELFRFDIDALSVSAHLDLTPLIGEEITLRLLQPDGSHRAWHGFCTNAVRVSADGGLARYRLRLEPALCFLRYRRDCFLFQDKDATGVIAELLADYPQVTFSFDITQTLAVRPVCTQYRENDLAFFQRLLASEGLSFRFMHDQDGENAGSGASVIGHAKHQLIIFDSNAKAPGLPGGRMVRFHGIRASDSDDAINRFSAQRQIQANAVVRSSWDASRLHATAAEHASSLAAGELPALAMHDGRGAHRFADAEAAARHAELALAAFELRNKTFSGGGSLRRMAAGHAFNLTQHDAYGANENSFTVLWVEHAGANNLEIRTGSLAGTTSSTNSAMALERGTYRNTFSCVRETVPIVPDHTAKHSVATAAGAQSALVVGLPDSALTTNRGHQIKVQFPWQRGARPHTGGLRDTGNAIDTRGNAPGDQCSGTWVRVSEALAGPNWGTSFLPRIGGEVLVDFIEGDMDRPVVVAQLYNGADLPPYAAGVDSGINHAGVISGLHSRALEGAGYNQWVVDDTQGQLRMRLATSSATSQLNLGYLVAQAPYSAQRGQYRGTGFELRTDGWGILRAADGMLLSTTPRQGLGKSVTSTQMDAAESVGVLKGAQALTNRMCEAAAYQKTCVSEAANAAQQSFITMVDPVADGKHAGVVNGQPSSKATYGTRNLDAPAEKFGKPLVLMDAPTNINWASPASSVMFAGRQLHWSTQDDLHLTAAHTVAGVAGNASTVFTHAGGILAYAANGPVSIAAHTNRLEVLAEQAVTIISANKNIEIKAARKITVVAGQSSVTLEGGNITFSCPGQFSAKGGQRLFSGGASKPAMMERLPDARATLPDGAFQIKNEDASSKPIESFDEQIQFLNANGAVLAHTKYTLMLADGSTLEGITDQQGKTPRISSDGPQAILRATLQPHEISACCPILEQEPAQSMQPLRVELKGVATNSRDVGTSLSRVKTPEGESRGLTAGETLMAQLIFRDSIDYAKVKIHNGEFLWLGMQPDETAMTPNGEMYFNPKSFLEDYSSARFPIRLWFMHEMVHIWQYQLGYPVKFRGAVRLGLSYGYTLDISKHLSDYNMEAQGNILSDFWALKQFGTPPTLWEVKHIGDYSLYEKVLHDFIVEPSNVRNLPGNKR